MARPLVSVVVAEGALERTYYATPGPYPRGQGRITTAEDNCGRESTARRKLAWIFVGVALANTPARKYTPFLPVSPANSPTSHYRC